MGEDRGIRLFRKSGNRAHEYEEKPFSTERELQAFFEANLYELVQVHFLVSEYVTGPPHHSRIDTLGLDEDGRPVVVEFKRRSNQNIINQGLYYLDWLRNNEARFRRLVDSKFNRRSVENIDFANAWLLCVAWEFTEWDFVAAKESRREIELWQYFRFDDDLVALINLFRPTDDELTSSRDPVSAIPTAAEPEIVTASHELSQEGWLAQGEDETDSPDEPQPDFNITSGWRSASPELRALFKLLHDYMLQLSPEVQVLPGKQRIAFKGNFFILAVYVRSRSDMLQVYASVDPAKVKLEPGFTRDTQGYPLNHNRLEITIRNRSDLERARPLIRQAWEHDVSGEKFSWAG